MKSSSQINTVLFEKLKSKLSKNFSWNVKLIRTLLMRPISRHSTQRN